MTDPYKSIDEMINQIRLDADGKVKAADDAKLTAEVKATFLEDQLNKAVSARAAAERITMALLTQFSTVEKVFAEAKEMALKVESGQKAEPTPEPPPPNPIDTIHAELEEAKKFMNNPPPPETPQ